MMLAIVLDLVQPVRGVGDGGGTGRDAEVECGGHGGKIGKFAAKCQSMPYVRDVFLDAK